MSSATRKEALQIRYLSIDSNRCIMQHEMNDNMFQIAKKIEYILSSLAAIL
jgi:hypothetical protein